MASLWDLAIRLRAYASGEIERAEVEQWLDSLLAADPLGAEATAALAAIAH